MYIRVYNNVYSVYSSRHRPDVVPWHYLHFYLTSTAPLQLKIASPSGHTIYDCPVRSVEADSTIYKEIKDKASNRRGRERATKKGSAVRAQQTITAWIQAKKAARVSSMIPR